MKIKLLILSLLIFLSSSLTVNASQLPKEVKNYLISQKKVPTVRFDGIVVYNQDVMYIPVYPAYPKEVETVSIVKTYPENQSMDKLPDVVLFNNNFALLKVIKIGDGNISVKNLPEWPTEIKTGLLPQDIMVPKGFVLPDSLVGILGDVQIPLIGSAKTSTFITKKMAPLPSGQRVVDTKIYDVPVALKDKLFFVNNFQTEYLQVYSPTVSEPLYSLKTTGVMKDVKPVLNGKFLLVATKNKKNIDVVDVKNEYVAKNIDLTAVPSEILVDDINNRAYVASIEDESLIIIDLISMSMKEKIQLVGSPQRMTLSKDGTKLLYSDMKTSNIYALDFSDSYSNKLITNFPNVTEMLVLDNVLYAISRTSPKLRIVYFDLFQDNEVVKNKKESKREQQRKKEEQMNAESLTADLVTDYDLVAQENQETEDEKLIQNMKTYSTSIKDVSISNKPVDMYERNGKIFVLCASDNSVYSYNVKTNELRDEKLPVGGFSKAFTPVPNSNLAVVTNMSDLKYVVYDMDKEIAVKSFPVNDYINTITILDR